MNYEPDHFLNRTSNFRLSSALHADDKSRTDKILDKMNRTHEGNIFGSFDNK